MILISVENDRNFLMATNKQILAVEKTVENGGNVTKAMRDVGYSESTVNNPSNLTHSKGYKEILLECGLTESFIVKSLVDDIIKKPEKRLGELTLASDLLGLRKRGLIIEDKTEEKLMPERREELEELSHVFDEYYKATLENKDSFTFSLRKSNLPNSW